MWQQEQYLRCPDCHTRRDEWFEGDSKRPKEAYVAISERCPGCERLQLEMEGDREDGPSAMRGMHYKLVRPEHVPPPIIPKS